MRPKVQLELRRKSGNRLGDHHDFATALDAAGYRRQAFSTALVSSKPLEVIEVRFYFRGVEAVPVQFVYSCLPVRFGASLELVVMF